MRNIVLFLIIAFVSISSIAQPSLGYTEGVIVKKNGDSLNGFVEIKSGYEDVVNYRFTDEGNILSIRTKDVSKIRTDIHTFESIPIGKKDRLMSLVADGPMKLYRIVDIHRNTTAAPAMGGIAYFGKPVINYVIYKMGSYEEVKEKNFKSVVSEILKDCDKVVERINANFYEFGELEHAFNDYFNCQTPRNFWVKRDGSLAGIWNSDMTDELTKKTIGTATMTFTIDGKLIYDMIDGNNVERINLVYHTVKDSLYSSQPPNSEQQVTRYKLEDYNNLVIELSGTKTKFIRKKIDVFNK